MILLSSSERLFPGVVSKIVMISLDSFSGFGLRKSCCSKSLMVARSFGSRRKHDCITFIKSLPIAIVVPFVDESGVYETDKGNSM